MFLLKILLFFRINNEIKYFEEPGQDATHLQHYSQSLKHEGCARFTVVSTHFF